MNEEHSIGKLLEVAWEIEKNPSKLHCNRKHNAPQTPDFDWNVFVGRIDKIIEQDREVKNPLRRCQLILSLLNADLTYDNRSRAKTLLHKVIDTLQQSERKFAEDREKCKKETEEVQKQLMTSTFLTDEFWQTIVEPVKKSNVEPVKKSKNSVLDEEKQRYQQLLRNIL